MKIVVPQIIVSCFYVLYDIFLIISNPACWIRVGRYSSEWDKELNELMSKYVFKENSCYVVKLGPKNIWIANHPFASFAEYHFFGHDKNGILPSRATALRAKIKLDRDLSDDFSHLIDEAEKIKDSVKMC